MRLNELYAAYKDQVHFFIVYIREAHPDNGWQVPNNLIEKILYDAPTSDDERLAIATACQLDLDLAMPLLLDRMDNAIDEKYIGLPMRQFLIDRHGKIAFAGNQGPFGWDDVAFEEVLKEMID